MTWPTVAVNTTNVDQTTDSPATARSDILDALQKLNAMIAQVSVFMGGHLADASAVAARTTLGAAASGALATSGITGAAASGANNDITGLTALASVPSVISSAIAAAGAPQLFPLTASVAANALTINLATTNLDFRNATLNSGVVTRIASGALSIIVPSTATLGSVSGTPLRVGVAVAYNGGTPVLCVVNGTIDESALYSPTTISTGAGTAATVYSASAVSSNSPMRLIGYVDVPNATAGTYAAITEVQSYGGQIVASSLGYGQTWQNVTASRALGTTNTNTTGKPIFVSVCATPTGGGLGSALSYSINGVLMGYGGAYASGAAYTSGYSNLHFVVPAGATYTVNSAATAALNIWSELR